MTVSELRSLLEAYPGDLEVLCGCSELEEVSGVEAGGVVEFEGPTVAVGWYPRRHFDCWLSSDPGGSPPRNRLDEAEARTVLILRTG